MKAKNRSNYFIVLAVVICSGVLLAALTFALSGFPWKKGGRTLEIDFRASTGIKRHSWVRYAGAPAGTVTGIRYLAPEERRKSKSGMNAVRVTVKLNDAVPVIGADVTAELAAETLLGEKFILLTPGAPDAPPLPEGAIIQGAEVIALDDVARSAQSAIANVNEVLIGLKQDYPDLVRQLSGLLAEGNSLLRQGSNFVEHADGALTNASEVLAAFKSDYAGLMTHLNEILGQVKGTVTNADRALEQAGAFVNRADALIKNNETSLHATLNELRVVAQNLKVISTYTKALTQALGEKPSRLIWGRKKTQLPTEQKIIESPEPLPLERPGK